MATAGVSSAGQLMMEMIRAPTKASYRHVPYDGGNPAVIAAVAGETPLVSCLLVEAGDMIKAKRLIPLAAMADKPVPLDGYGDIPPITNWIPGIVGGAQLFRHLAAEGRAAGGASPRWTRSGRRDREIRRCCRTTPNAAPRCSRRSTARPPGPRR